MKFHITYNNIVNFKKLPVNKERHILSTCCILFSFKFMKFIPRSDAGFITPVIRNITRYA